MADADQLEPELSIVFERLLDVALDTSQVTEAIERCGSRVERAELRARALQAAGAIAAFADIEYREYRGAAAAASGRDDGQPIAADPDPAVCGAGGLPPASSVFTMRVAAGAGMLLLLSGCGLHSFGGRPYVGGGLITAGSLVAAVALGAAIGDLIWLLATLARSRSMGATHAEVTRSRRAWELAMLERGIVPFLLGRLEEARIGERRDGGAR